MYLKVVILKILENVVIARNLVVESIDTVRKCAGFVQQKTIKSLVFHNIRLYIKKASIQLI